MVIEAYTFIITQQPIDLLKWVFLEKFQGKLCTPRMIKEMGSIFGEREDSNKKKRSKFLTTYVCWIKGPNGPNNPLITCNLFNKATCNWAF